MLRKIVGTRSMPRTSGSTIANFLLAAVVTVASLLAVEYLLLPVWSTGSTDRELALLGFVATPNSLVDDTRINGQGFTGAELTRYEPATGTRRLLTLGGSALFNRRMTERMTEAWAPVFPVDIEVVGGALRTHTTRASLIKLEQHFADYYFDYVLIYHAINDLWASNVPKEDFREDYSHLDPWYRRSGLLNDYLVARYSYNLLSGRAGVFPRENSNAADFASLATFEQNMRQLVDIVVDKGGVPVLMTFAWHIPENYTLRKFRRYELGYNNPEHYDECPVELWGEPAFIREGMTRSNDIVRRIAREYQLPLIDLEQSLSADIENFGDVVHLSEIGTDRLIEVVGSRLVELEATRIDPDS